MKICECGCEYPDARYDLGYRCCLKCGETRAKQVTRTVAPMHKSNYMFITDVALLKQLNPKRTT